MTNNKVQYMLKFQKASSKLFEYSTRKEDYPKFPLDYRELSLPTVAIISDFSNAIINNLNDKLIELSKKINFCSNYYEAAFASNDEPIHSEDFLFNAIISFFYSNDFGSAKVLINKISFSNIKNIALKELYILLMYIFGLNISNYKEYETKFVKELLSHIDESSIEKYSLYAFEKAKTIYLNDNVDCAFYHEATIAIVKITILNSAKVLLPLYSGLSNDIWNDYFKMNSSIKTLWPAQKLIGEKEVLKGKNSIIQLPTGVGKTKSIELIIRSCFLSKRGHIAVIIAPLKALCNEISLDMMKAFKDAKVNLISDLLEEDYEGVFNEVDHSIIVCTPEKMQFIIRHTNDIIKKMDLIIFDESHLFDDKSRGADYELLITNIKSNLEISQQLVLMSAVLSNADSIAKWAFNNNGIVSYDANIKSTFKSFAFTSKDSNIYYYTNDFSNYDYYIPKTFAKFELNKKPKERKKKIFPENNSTDYALFLTNKLVLNGGIAIFTPQRRSISTILKRLNDISERKYDISNILINSNLNELEKYEKYFTDIYGTYFPYAKAVTCGALPHHRYLSTGIKMAIEYSIKKSYCKLIVCTSTLAQGVNIPIKYLIVTSLKNMDTFIPTRSIQNLIGRTARSGTFTEGSIIVTEPKYYDDKNTPHGKYEWRDISELFDYRQSEPCSSAILDLLKTQKIVFDRGFNGNKIFDSICDNLCNEKWDKIVYAGMIEILKKHNLYNSLTEYKVGQIIKGYYKTIGSLESEMCYILSTANLDEGKNEFEFVENYLKNLLAYNLADDTEKIQLLKLFRAIFDKIKTLNINCHNVGKTLGNINLGLYLNRIIESFDLNRTIYSDSEILKIVVETFDNFYNEDISIPLCEDWINSKSIAYLMDKYKVEENKIEQLCYGLLSYEMSFYISNLIDYLDDNNCNIENLNQLKSKFKYGVNTNTKILISENLFDDRYVVESIYEIINQEVQNEYVLRDVLSKYKEQILRKLEILPSFFLNRFLTYIQ